MSIAVLHRGELMDKKIISISSKHQITIPQNFFAKLGFGDFAECFVRDNEIVIRPLREINSGEFSEQILEDLIKKGYSGEELLIKFKETQRKIRPAVEAMLNEAKNAARGEGEYESFEDVFGVEE